MKRLIKRFLKQFRYGEKGFTLIELLVVIAVLGVLAAVAIPNVGKFIGTGTKEAASTEHHNIQTAVLAAMVDGGVSGFGSVQAFGFDPTTSTTTSDIIAGTTTVGAFIVGGVAGVAGLYSVDTEGTVTQTSYPGLP